MSFDHKHYVPILKGKRAEFPSLQALHSFDNITPLYESVPSSPPEFVPQKMNGFWGDRSYFIDGLFLDDEDAPEEDAQSHPLIACFRYAGKNGHRAIPVTGTGRSPAYQAALRSIVVDQGNGLAVRLVPDDFEDQQELEQSVSAVVDYVGVGREQIDMIIDAGLVFGMGSSTLRQMHSANLQMLSSIHEWRTLTVVASAFPPSLAPLTRDVWNTEPRIEWHGWQGLISQAGPLPRLPAYGDYTIANPDLPPGGRATILGQLRYTTPENFLVWKGHNVFTHPKGYGQFNGICADLIRRPEYRGRSFSQGDAEIYEKATTGDSSGNAETWRKIGVNHHLETAKDQIANLP